MQENLERSLTAILADEGGFALRPAEPGGSVNKGISMLVLDEWRRKQGKPPPQVDDLRRISKAEASAIYTEQYWKPLQADKLPAGLDYALVNIGVMEGPTGARTLLQQALGVPVSGHYDDETWEEIEKTDPKFLIVKLIALHLNKKLHAMSAGKYGIGWGDRIVRVLTRALEMA